MNLKNKNVLFIAPKFFGYECKIKETMRKLGANVYLVYENMDEVSMIYRSVYVYLPSIKDKIMTKYYKRAIQKINKQIDVCFIIRGSSLTKEVLFWIKSLYPNIEMIMYQWDSVKNNSRALLISKYCNKNFTFDMKDAEKFQWTYRPLFYFESSNLKSRKYDLTFIGSVHSQRMIIANKLSGERKYKKYIYLYSNRFHYLKQKYILRKSNFRSIQSCYIYFKKISLKKTNEIFSNSKVVIDYTHPDQNGYTMRTIESLGHNCKLVTNNKNIEKADFYNPNNIYIYEGNNINIPTSFIDSSYQNLNSKIFYEYSLNEWIKNIFNYE